MCKCKCNCGANQKGEVVAEKPVIVKDPSSLPRPTKKSLTDYLSNFVRKSYY